MISNSSWRSSRSDPVQGGGRGAAAVGTPTGSGPEPQRGSGGRAPSYILAPGFGAEPQLPAYMIQSSQPVWSAARSQICLNPVWRVGSEGWRSESERSEAERSEAAGPEPTLQN